MLLGVIDTKIYSKYILVVLSEAEIEWESFILEASKILKDFSSISNDSSMNRTEATFSHL